MHAVDKQAASDARGIPLLPVINAHFFAATDQGAALFAQAARMRQMSRANVRIREGGIPAAVAEYQETPTPELLVVESSAGREGIFDELMALADVTLPETRVVVVGHVNDIELYRALLAEGVSDYVALPTEPVRLVAALAQIFAGEKAESLGRHVAFLGAKGGVGSSIIAHNVGWLLSEVHQINTVIADLDLAFGTAGLDFDANPAQGIAEALEAVDRLDATFIDRLLHKCSEHLMLLAAPCTLERGVSIQEQALDLVLDTLREVVPLTILDLPSDWMPWMQAALRQADSVVLVSTPELAALRNTRSLAETLRALRSADEPPLLVLNQVGMGKRPEIPGDEFAQAVGLEVFVEIPFAEATFGEAALKGRMVIEEQPDGEVAHALRRLAAAIGKLPAPEKKKGGALASLLHPLLEKLPGLGGRASG